MLPIHKGFPTAGKKCLKENSWFHVKFGTQIGRHKLPNVDVLADLAARRMVTTSDLQIQLGYSTVASSNPCHHSAVRLQPWANFYTHVPLSPRNIIWYWPNGRDVLRLGR